jgi:hypothetical protein
VAEGEEVGEEEELYLRSIRSRLPCRHLVSVCADGEEEKAFFAIKKDADEDEDVV